MLFRSENFHESDPLLSDFSWDDLELFLGEQDRQKHLFGALNRTHTSMGDVQLQRWLVKPTDNIETIRNRQELIQYLADNDEVRDRLDGVLESIARNENSLLSFWDKNDTRQLVLRRVVEPEVDENVQRLLDAERNVFQKVLDPITSLFRKKKKFDASRRFDTNASKLHVQAALSNLWNSKGALMMTAAMLMFYFGNSYKTESHRHIKKALNGRDLAELQKEDITIPVDWYGKTIDVNTKEIYMVPWKKLDIPFTTRTKDVYLNLAFTEDVFKNGGKFQYKNIGRFLYSDITHPWRTLKSMGRYPKRV